MSINAFDLKYTICFTTCGKQVLMIQRSNPPWKSKWNGLGGRIEKGETPLKSLYREMMEEANLKLQNSLISFAGIVTWDTGSKNDELIPGMYAFLATLPEDRLIWENSRETPEGIIAWKSLEWVCDRKNTEVADNVVLFLPKMLSSKNPMRYHCVFKKEKFSHLQISPLPLTLTL